MRVWCDIFSADGVKQGTGITLNSASATRALDGAGSFSVTFPAVSESLFNLAQLERRASIYVEQDEQTRYFGGGIIRELNVDDSSGGAKVVIGGPDPLDALTRKSVLLGRSYQVSLIGTIAASLTALAPPWSIIVDDADNVTQSVRFDGVSVLKALISIASKAGYHIREGETPYTLEMGPFGDDSGIVALHPSTLSVELYSRDNLLLIDKISQKSSSRDVINWIIPVGAGEGDAALTMEYAVNVTPEQMEGPDGRTLYFIKNDDSIAEYGQIEKVVTFKDIVPVLNEQAAKQYGSEVLYAAAQAWLERNAWPLTTYTMTAKKCRTALRVGDKITVAYKGIIETEDGSHTYMDVDDLFWVMKITETANDSGLSVALEIANVDRRERDIVQDIGEGLEAIEVRNLTPRTHTVWVTKDKTEPVWGSPSADVHQAIATFYLDIDDKITDILEVKLHFVSLQAYSTVDVTTSATWNGDLWAYYTRAPNFPQNISLLINGEDVTSEYGGPWGTVSASSGDIEIDITDKIRDALGDIYREHVIQFTCENASGERSYAPHTTASGNGQSGGLIRCEIKARLVVKD